MTLSYLKMFRWNNLTKNILIFFPYILNQQYFYLQDINQLLLGFVAFSLITLASYLINDISDFETDKVNILKNKKYSENSSSKKIKFYYIFIIFLTFLLFSYFFTEVITKEIFFYLILFMIYNFYTKKIFIFDIFFLICFYLVRFMYGSSLLEINIGTLVIFFLFNQFLILSLTKRMIQIISNNLLSINKIIPYDRSHIRIITYIMYIFFILNLIIFINYIVYFQYSVNLMELIITNKILNLAQLLFLFSIYIAFHLRIFYLLKNELIKIDLVAYLIKDKIVMTLSSLFLIILII